MTAAAESRVRAAISTAEQTGECDLSDLGLSTLPPAVSELADLQMLSLRGNRLTEFPAALAKLPRLNVLALDGNLLTHLPPSIAELGMLERLTVSENALVEIPPEIGRLDRLNTLTISRNQLTHLPAEIGHLHRLEALVASGNRLMSLPAEIGNLDSLEFLSVVDNQLTALPSSLAGPLRRGLFLQLNGNPFETPLVELHDRDPLALVAYLESLADAVPQYEAKMLVVGEGNTGKTSLVAALRDAPFLAERPTTHGIEMHDIGLRHAEVGRELLVHAWDFGGQEIYRITHQFFFSKNALYLVVWKPRDGQEQNEVAGWLRRIRLRLAAEGRAFVVATHCSGERRPELDFPILAQEFGALLGGSFEVDSQTRRGIADLRTAIAAGLEILPQIGQAISHRWIAARDEILGLAQTEPQISLERFADICASHGVPDDQVTGLAEMLHLAGQVIYYAEDRALRDFVVLDPEWLTKAISYVLEDEATRQAGGILDHARLRRIWQNHGSGHAYQAAHHPYLLRLMEKFDVSYRVIDDPDRSLVAQLAPYERPALPWDARTAAPPRLRRLAMLCQLSEPVPGLIAWLTVRHNDAATGLYWRNGVFLRHPVRAYASEALLELQTPTRLVIDVRAPAPDYFFNVLRYSIEDLMTRRWPGLGYELHIPCPTVGDKGVSCPGTMLLTDLMVYREEGETRFLCAKCRTRHDLSLLLTGFAQPAVSMQSELDRLHQRFRADLAEVRAEITDLQVTAADAANAIRKLLHAIDAEITDCPRLFTLSRDDNVAGLRRLRVDQQRYRLVLWCEQPNHWHPWTPATYDIDRPKEWLARVAPYALLVLRTLELMVPLASAVAGVGLPAQSADQIKSELDLMKAVLDLLPASAHTEYPDLSGADQAGAITPAQGAASRASRSLILQCDPWRIFGDLRRVQARSGEFLWICPAHYAEYDPGLPALPV